MYSVLEPKSEFLKTIFSRFGEGGGGGGGGEWSRIKSKLAVNSGFWIGLGYLELELKPSLVELCMFCKQNIKM